MIKMLLAEYDEMIQALLLKRLNKPFDMRPRLDDIGITLCLRIRRA